jgi:hypothetical protein
MAAMIALASERTKHEILSRIALNWQVESAGS